MQNIRFFKLKIFIILVVNFLVYLNRLVFIMYGTLGKKWLIIFHVKKVSEPCDRFYYSLRTRLPSKRET